MYHVMYHPLVPLCCLFKRTGANVLCHMFPHTCQPARVRSSISCSVASLTGCQPAGALSKHCRTLHFLEWALDPEFVILFLIVTARVRSTTGGYVFSLSTTRGRGSAPSPSDNTFTGPMSFLGVPQSQVGG